MTAYKRGKYSFLNTMNRAKITQGNITKCYCTWYLFMCLIAFAVFKKHGEQTYLSLF